MSNFSYTELISSLLDPRLVNPGSTLIHVDVYGPKSTNFRTATLSSSKSYNRMFMKKETWFEVVVDLNVNNVNAMRSQ